MTGNFGEEAVPTRRSEMKFKRATMTLVSASVVVLGGLAVLPAAAFASSPSSLWVNATGAVAPSATTGTSCANPGFTTIQAALDAAPANATVHVSRSSAPSPS